MIKVINKGEIIPDDDKQKIFENQTKYQKVGLFVSKILSGIIGGDLQLLKSESRTTVFAFSISLKQKASQI